MGGARGVRGGAEEEEEEYDDMVGGAVRRVRRLESRLVRRESPFFEVAFYIGTGIFYAHLFPSP